MTDINKNSCGCKDHTHNHLHNCGCSSHSHALETNLKLDEAQLSFIKELGKKKYLPMAEFILKSKENPEYESIALSSVFIRSLNDSMEKVCETQEFLKALELQGLIYLDYDIPLEGYTYEEYYNCDLYKYFCETVKEGKDKPDFFGDTPFLQLGSIALTEEAEKKYV